MILVVKISLYYQIKYLTTWEPLIIWISLSTFYTSQSAIDEGFKYTYTLKTRTVKTWHMQET